MFKVSFKESPKSPCKLIYKEGKKTEVMLRGTCVLPDFFRYVPEEISAWISGQTHLEIYEDVACNQLVVYSKGVARCHPDDKYDTVLGERIAESKAKEYIYQFFYGLCKRLYDYYDRIMFGHFAKTIDGNDSLQKTDIRYKHLLQREKQHQVELLKNKSHGGEQQQPVN